MSKFSDGFSDKSYEDLLNEYAGDSLPGKPINTPTPAPKKNSIGSKYNKVFSDKANEVNKTPSKRVSKDTFDIDLSNAFGGNNTAGRNSGRKFDPYSIPDPHYDDSSYSRDDKFNVHIDYSNEEYGAEPGYNDEVLSPKKSVKKKKIKKRSNLDKIFVKQDGKVKFDAKAFTEIAGNFIKEHKNGLILLACCVAISVILSVFALSCVNDILAINRKSEAPVEVVLPNDADYSDAIKVLDEAGLIKNRLFCNIFAKIMGFSDDKFLPGVYYLTEDMGVEKMLTRFKTSTVRGAIISIVIPEGFTIDQIFERLEKNKVCTAESLYKVLETVDFSDEYNFIAKIDNKEDRYLVLEGYMHPATYEFEQGADPATVIRAFLNKFQSIWTEEYAAKATELGMSIDEVIRLASVVEKEGNGKGQFLQISSVLHNRLNRAGVYPTLDCDSTWDYIENNIYKRVQSSTERDRYEDNYWTYQCVGLPAGAICNPGVNAIEAALYPAASRNYYFRHDKNGEIYMAETYDQHQANGKKVEKINAEG